VFYIGCRGTFNLFGFCLSNTPLCFLWGLLNIMMFLVFLDPTSKGLVECI
jgi:hypothetical protein